ncbi:MAG: hypothetical protein AAGJ46_20575 [Planctomycetota bacterium]
MSNRSVKRLALYFSVLALVAASGCGTTRVLKRHTVGFAETAMDVHQQQVLDNLARFVADPYSVPSFSVATSGTARVDDGYSGGLSTMSFTNVGFSKADIGLGGQRNASQFWSLDSVSDPRKLELMRCAFQRAVANCTGEGESFCCPDCQKRYNAFYTGKAYGREPYQLVVERVPSPCPLEEGESDESNGSDGSAGDGQGVLPPPKQGNAGDEPLPPLNWRLAQGGIVSGDRVGDPCSPEASGTVTSNCLQPGCCTWFSFGPKSEVPKGINRRYVGHSDDLYVWVPPGPGRDQLARLTLTVLDFAVNDARVERTKQITLYRTVDSFGNEYPGTKDTASKTVVVNVPVSELGEGVLAYPADHLKLFPTVTGDPSKPTSKLTFDQWRAEYGCDFPTEADIKANRGALNYGPIRDAPTRSATPLNLAPAVSPLDPNIFRSGQVSPNSRELQFQQQQFERFNVR